MYVGAGIVRLALVDSEAPKIPSGTHSAAVHETGGGSMQPKGTRAGPAGVDAARFSRARPRALDAATTFLGEM